NIITPKSLLQPLPSLPSGVERRVYEGDNARPMKPELLTAALALLFADILAVLALQAGSVFAWRGLGRARASSLAVAFLVAGALLLAAGPARGTRPSQPPAPPPAPARVPGEAVRAIQATAKVTFGYVLSGDAATDETSRQGLIGLNKFLMGHTAVEPGDP